MDRVERPAPADSGGVDRTGTMLHDDEDGRRVAIDDLVVVAHNVRMTKLAQDIDFLDQHFLLLPVHLAVVEFLPYHPLQRRGEDGDERHQNKNHRGNNNKSKSMHSR